MNADPDPRAHVVIIGGGFAGLAAARTLRRAHVRITLIDRRNHHTFQPLLYQVATAGLSPAQIAAPIRRILAQQKNCTVLLAPALAIDAASRTVALDHGESLAFDYLIVAAGATHSYFGHPEWAALAPGLKTIDDAVELRRRFLLAFENAERESDLAKRRTALTFVVIGGGPTGVEMAGAMAEIARSILKRDFKTINTADARVLLIQAGDRVLETYPEALSARAQRDLEALGVQVLTGARVTKIDATGVEATMPPRPGQAGISGAPPLRIDAACIVWAAGVRASPLAASLGVPLDRAGRVIVNPDLSVPGFANIFVAGDLASAKLADGAPVPGIAPGAIQMGTFIGKTIARETAAGGRARPAPPGASAPAPRRGVFRYINKGELATIGRNRAVGIIGFGINIPLVGWLAWVSWALIHVTFLIGFRNRVVVMFDWIWSYIFLERGARLITGNSQDAP
ncbi:NAD(P)/FAD-dependent oxidoreductase [soil metagenome]